MLADIAERAYRERMVSTFAGHLIEQFGLFNIETGESVSVEEFIARIRRTTESGDLAGTVSLLGRDASSVFLKRAVKELPPSKRAHCVELVWQVGYFGKEHPLFRGNDRERRVGAIRLFRSAPELHERAVDRLPRGNVRVYRGVVATRRPRVDGTVVCSLSWTLRRDVALWFANRYRAIDRDALAKVGQTKPYLPFIAEARVRRRAVLAYFPDGDEEEVVLDPAGLIQGSVSVRAVTDADQVDIDRVQKEIDGRQ